MSSAARRAERGVCSAGFNTTVLPQASAGAIFQESMSIGKFQGIYNNCNPVVMKTKYFSTFVAYNLATDSHRVVGGEANEITIYWNALSLNLISPARDTFMKDM